MIEDPRAPHQIRLRRRRGQLIVTCTCLNTWDGIWEMAWKTPWRNPGWQGARIRGAVIAAAQVLPAAEAVALHSDWHARQGIEVST